MCPWEEEGGVYLKNYVHTKTFYRDILKILIVISQNWKQHKCLSKFEQINKFWYCSYNIILPGMEINELLIHVKIWVDCKTIMLREVSQAKWNIYCMIPFIENSRKYKLIYNDKSVVVRGWRVGWGGERKEIIKGPRLLRVMAICTLLIMVIVSWVYEFVKM